jgi:hydrogenase-1 operon protein HyaE
MNGTTARSSAPSAPSAASATSALHPLLTRLVQLTGAAMPGADEFDAWARASGAAMVVFAEEPGRSKETLDIAVIVPELHAAAARAFRVALLLPEAARALAPRYGFARWPAFVMLRDGQYLGAVDGIRDWDVYLAELKSLLAATPSRPPGVGIAVAAAGAAAEPPCH